jgi:hypothetical protein
MSAETNQRPVPVDVEFHYPDCPFCWKELNSDGGGLYCETCDATWDEDGTHGGWSDPDAAQCEAVEGRYLPGGSMYEYAAENHPALVNRPPVRCVRTAGHAGNHADKYGDGWDAASTATAEQLAADAPGYDVDAARWFSNREAVQS